MAHYPDAVSFQVEYFAGGKWQSDTRYADREEAESAATRMLESSRSPTAVRVTQECYDAKTNLFNDIIVFRRSRLDEHNSSARSAQLGAGQQWAERRARQRSQQNPSHTKKKPGSSGKGVAWYIVVALSLVIGATAAIWTMHHLMFTT